MPHRLPPALPLVDPLTPATLHMQRYGTLHIHVVSSILNTIGGPGYSHIKI